MEFILHHHEHPLDSIFPTQHPSTFRSNRIKFHVICIRQINDSWAGQNTLSNSRLSIKLFHCRYRTFLQKHRLNRTTTRRVGGREEEANELPFEVSHWVRWKKFNDLITETVKEETSERNSKAMQIFSSSSSFVIFTLSLRYLRWKRTLIGKLISANYCVPANEMAWSEAETKRASGKEVVGSYANFFVKMFSQSREIKLIRASKGKTFFLSSFFRGACEQIRCNFLIMNVTRAQLAGATFPPPQHAQLQR